MGQESPDHLYGSSRLESIATTATAVEATVEDTRVFSWSAPILPHHQLTTEM